MPTKLIAALLLVLVISCKGKKAEENKSAAPQQQASVVDVLVAGTKQLNNIIEANGTAVSNELLEIHPEASGRLTYLNVPDGASVAAGTVLAKINDADLQAQLKKSSTQLELAVKTEERLRKLLTINGINQADYDVALNNVNNIKADIELLNAQIAKTVVKAPFGGVLGLRQTSPGAYVTPQTILATLIENNRIKIDFTVPEQYAHLIKKGGVVNVVSANSTTQQKATVIATEPEINTATRNLKARAILEGKAIGAGSFVKVLLNAGNSSNNIVIPTNAIIPDAASKKVIVVKEGKGKFVSVETGLRTASGVEITKGLNIGDSVVVTGVLFVRPNAAVKVRSVKKAEELMKE